MPPRNTQQLCSKQVMKAGQPAAYSLLIKLKKKTWYTFIVIIHLFILKLNCTIFFTYSTCFSDFVSIFPQTLMGKVSLTVGRLKAGSRASSRKNSTPGSALKKSESSVSNKSKGGKHSKSKCTEIQQHRLSPFSFHLLFSGSISQKKFSGILMRGYFNFLKERLFLTFFLNSHVMKRQICFFFFISSKMNCISIFTQCFVCHLNLY